MTTVVEYYPGYSQVQVSQNFTVQTIASITQANPMVVTTVNTQIYKPGMMVTFLIPQAFGMQQINNLVLQVIASSDTTVTCNIDSTNFTLFAYPSPLPSAYTPPSIIPVSSGQSLPPQFLPYGNENAFDGTIFNNGII